MNDEKLQARFLFFVNKQSGVRLNGLETDCWEWTGALYTAGYGQTRASWAPDKYAHRCSYILFNGEIPEGRLVRHKCDNRKCVNPAHLELGSKADNNKDCRDRNPKANGKKLGDEELPKIADRMKQGELLKDIANEYGMNWKCISRRLAAANLRPAYSYGAKITADMIAQMKALRDQNKSYETIATDLNLSVSSVWKYLQQ